LTPDSSGSSSYRRCERSALIASLFDAARAVLANPDEGLAANSPIIRSRAQKCFAGSITRPAYAGARAQSARRMIDALDENPPLAALERRCRSSVRLRSIGDAFAAAASTGHAGHIWEKSIRYEACIHAIQGWANCAVGWSAGDRRLYAFLFHHQSRARRRAA